MSYQWPEDDIRAARRWWRPSPTATAVIVFVVIFSLVWLLRS